MEDQVRWTCKGNYATCVKTIVPTTGAERFAEAWSRSLLYCCRTSSISLGGL